MESNELNSATDQCLGGAIKLVSIDGCWDRNEVMGGCLLVSFLGLNVEATQKGRIARDNNDFIVDRVDVVIFRIR